MVTKQPSALSSTGLSEQCVAPAVESLIQSAHVLAQHFVIELQAQYAEKTTLLERRLDSFVQERAQMQHQIACLQGTTIELHGELKNLHEQVRTIGTADQKKEREAERSSKELLARLEETEKELENTKLSTNKRSLDVQELKVQMDQVQKQLEEYDGMKSLSMFDLMKQMMVLNKKSTDSGAA
jgi:chromosome segregation ATPase